jgi:UDP-N-acetyl-2-amino-2-deoxyglucuronate dehydrogenase
MGTVRVRWKRDQAYYAPDAWRGTWELDGGVMSQQPSHHLDLLQWFMGPVERLQCQIVTRLMKIEVEDTAAALFRFGSGALGVFEATTATRRTDLEASLSILGEHGSVIHGHGHADYPAEVVRSILSNQAGLVEGAEGRKNVVILTAKARIGRRSTSGTTSPTS